MANLIEKAKNQVDMLVKAAYGRAAENGQLPGGVALRGSIEIPKDESNGDYACGYAMAAAREMKMPPRKIADILVENMELDGSYFKSCQAAGPGFMNFRLSPVWYKEVLKAVEEEGDQYGSCNIGRGEKVMVEFVSANPTGPMTIGNARGGVLGDTLASVLQKVGYDVTREFYVNDAGNQIDLFGKSIDARYMQLCLGEDNYPFPDDGYHGDDIRALAREIYEKNGDRFASEDEAERQRVFVSWALPKNIELMKKHLERYRINFDNWFLESSLHESGYVEETVDLLTKAGLTYEKDGAVWLKNTELGADKDEVLKRSNGFYTYYAVDIAYHRNKFTVRGFDKVIDVWGADHHGHSVRFKATMGAECLGIDSDKLVFLIMQMVRLVRDGETIKVSKRTGKALTLNDLLDEISVDACRFFFNAKPDTHLEFDLGLAVREDSENPVYYVQYAHARICSLIKTLAQQGVEMCSAQDADMELLSSDAELDLIKQVSMLPEEVRLAAKEYDPSRINRYVIELAARFHRFYNSCHIRGEKEDVMRSRLKLAQTAGSVIKTCLDIIGVEAPEQM